MTISKDLLLAILSMDSYNREYGAGIEITGLAIGSATAKNHVQSGVSAAEYSAWQAAGFYAISYTLDEAVGDLAANTTVISYRGTDRYFV